MICPVCSADAGRAVAIYRPYLDYECTVYDCASCGSRFVPHSTTVYEALHAEPNSVYAGHAERANAAARLLSSGDIEGLRSMLCSTPKNRFVIETVESHPDVRSLLEVGCSLGEVSAYFAAKGYHVLGVDSAPSAVEQANRLFGTHYAQPDSERMAAGSPYDLVFHVGTIGCVASPTAFTEHLLSLLRPGGCLVFNAPNVRACRTTGSDWIEGAHPPDLVTLFDPDYWANRFGELAEVEVRLQELTPAERLLEWQSRFRKKRRGREPQQELLNAGGSASPIGRAAKSTRKPARFMLKAGAIVTDKLGILPTYIPEFGVYVVMRRREL